MSKDLDRTRSEITREDGTTFLEVQDRRVDELEATCAELVEALRKIDAAACRAQSWIGISDVARAAIARAGAVGD